MEIYNSSPQEGLKWRCRNHPNILCDFICIDGDAKDRVICFNCMQKQQIPITNVISMNCVLAANQQDILEAYPPLKDQKLSDKLKDVKLKKSVEEMDYYFQNLREEFEKEMQLALQKAKQHYIRLDKTSQPLFKEYFRIAEIEKLKQLIISDKQGAAKDLDDFIKDKWNKADENKNNLLRLMKQYDIEQQSYSLLLDQSYSIPLKMIECLQNMNQSQKSILSQITLIKSTIHNSQQMEITKVDNSIYQVKKGAKDSWDEVFLDPILDPLKKYILHIEVEKKLADSGNFFIFGLVKDQGKDNGYSHCQNMCYCNYENSWGITKNIKGSPMQSEGKDAGSYSFEVRVYLNEKFLRVASLPDYSSIAELDNPNTIDPKVAYRFFLSMYYQDDMMRIKNMSTVQFYDDRM